MNITTATTAEDFNATAPALRRDRPRQPAALTLATLVEGLRLIHDRTVRDADAARAATNERIRALEVTAARLAYERDTACRELRVRDRVNAALETELHDAGTEIRRLTEQVVELTAKRDLATAAAEDVTRALCDAERENTELRDARRWWRRR
jgi:chromosome segregation ATPase